MEVFEDIYPGCVEQGAQKCTVLWAHGRETPKAGTTKEVEEKRFGLIILMMGGENTPRFRFDADRLEKSIADIAQSLLEIVFRGDGRTKNEEREIVSAGKLFHEGFVEIRRPPAQTIIHMGERDTKIVFFPQGREDIEKADAVWTT